MEWVNKLLGFVKHLAEDKPQIKLIGTYNYLTRGETRRTGALIRSLGSVRIPNHHGSCAGSTHRSPFPNRVKEPSRIRHERRLRATLAKFNAELKPKRPIPYLVDMGRIRVLFARVSPEPGRLMRVSPTQAQSNLDRPFLQGQGGPALTGPPSVRCHDVLLAS